jgi:hypothetical protein
MPPRLPAQADPLPIILAADARFGPPDYVDDQIWALDESTGDPPGLVIRTTYGLRAKGMSLFPGFGRAGTTLTDPRAFVEPPRIEAEFPNYARLRLAPWEEVDVVAEYWVPESHALCGRFQLTNTSDQTQDFGFRLYALLRPDEGSTIMRERSFRGASVLSGASGGLAPVVFLTGGASVEAAAHPGLGLRVVLAPGETRHLVWAHGGLKTAEASFNLARSLVERAWDAEVARLEMGQAHLVDVDSGNPAWDGAFRQAQLSALKSLVGPTRHLPFPSPVASRLPDQGFSHSGDGRDYPGPWAGQTAELALSVVPLLSYAAPDLAQGVICDFLHKPSPEGSLDARPGLAGQRADAICPPILGGLALQVFRSTEDLAFLKSVRAACVMGLRAWFTSDHDRDEDGFPEWDNPMHAMREDSPTFAVWHDWAQGLNIQMAETPDLAAYLVHECRALAEIGRLVGEHDDDEWLEATGRSLLERLDAAWSDELHAYLPVDRDKHESPAGQEIVRKRGAFSHKFKGHFEKPVRLIFRCVGPEAEAKKLRLRIHGRSRRGRSRIERISTRRVQWFWDFGTVTTAKTYVEITQVEVVGLSDAFETEVRVADFTRLDSSSMMPLWAGVPSAERAEDLIQGTLASPERFWRRHGIPRCSASDPAYDPDGRMEACGVSPIQAAMLAEGLLAYGRRPLAADLFRRLMAAICDSLERHKAFRAVYHPDKLGGVGEREAILGAAPLRLFLDLVGVQLISPMKVRLEGRSPFEAPVRLRWRGLEITRQDDRTEITFPNGQQVSTQGEAPSVVEQLNR